MADVTIKLSLDEAMEVKKTVRESVQLVEKCLTDDAIMKDIRMRPDGETEILQMQDRHNLLTSALKAFR